MKFSEDEPTTPARIAITLDVDWAPDVAIELVDAILARGATRATWLATHSSPAVSRVAARNDLYELGIHPNFAPGSTQGDSPEAVLRHCFELVPDAATVRTHGLFCPSRILALLADSQLRTELSVFLPHATNLAPSTYSLGAASIVRLPYFWADDYECAQLVSSWSVAPELLLSPGLKIFNFHPIHVLLNSCDGSGYQRLKELHPDLSTVTPAEAERFVEAGPGVRTFFEELVDLAATDAVDACMIRDLAQEHAAAAATGLPT